MKKIFLILFLIITILCGCSTPEKTVETQPKVEFDVYSESNIQNIVNKYNIEKDFLILDRKLNLEIVTPKQETFIFSNKTKYSELPDIQAMSSDGEIVSPNDVADFTELDKNENLFYYFVKNKEDHDTIVLNCTLIRFKYNGDETWKVCGLNTGMSIDEMKNVLGEPSFYSESNEGNISMAYYYPLENDVAVFIIEKTGDFVYFTLSFGEGL